IDARRAWRGDWQPLGGRTLRIGTHTAAGSLDAHRRATGGHARPVEPHVRLPPGPERTGRRSRSRPTPTSALPFERVDRPGILHTPRGKRAHVEPRRLARSPFHSRHDDLACDEHEVSVRSASVCRMEEPAGGGGPSDSWAKALSPARRYAWRSTAGACPTTSFT